MNRGLLMLAVLWFCAVPAHPAQQGMDTLSVRPKVGLVLSGGGARGAAHVGVIRLIEEMQIPVDYVVGTSMGAIIGGLYAIGYTADDMDSLLMAQDWKTLLSNHLPRLQQPYAQRMVRKLYQINIPYEKVALTGSLAKRRDAHIKVRRSSLQALPKVLARPGLIDGNNLMDKFTQLTSPYCDSVSYDIFPHSFACVATDLVTGREVVLRQGCLAESMRASMSIPGVFYPVYKESQVLVDGGVANNFPVNVARTMGADIVIGVEVNSAHIEARDLRSFSSIFERLISTLGTDLHERNVDDTDILIQPRVKQFPVMGFDTTNLRQVIAIGYKAAQESFPQLDSLRQALSAFPEDTVRRDLETFRPTKSSEPFSGATSEEHTATSGNQIGLGLRLDSEEAAAALLSIGINRLELSGPKFGFATRLSINPWVMARIAYAWPDRLQLGASVKYGFSDAGRFYGKSGHAFSYHFYGSDVHLSNLFSRAYDLRIGARYDYFSVRNLVRSEVEGHSYTDTKSHDSYTSLYLRLRNDLYDAPYLPTQGYAYGVEVAYNIKNRGRATTDFWSLQVEASTLLPLGASTALYPAFYGRSLWGDAIPIVYANAMGGYLPGRYLRQQFPFIGLMGCDFMGRHLAILRMELRQRLSPDAYLSGIVNYAYGVDRLSLIRDGQGVWGIGVQFTYATPIGPLALCTHWNDRYHRLGAYCSFGFEF